MRLPVLLLLATSACTTRYDFAFEHGGEATVQLEPVNVEDDGVNLDLTLPGMTAEQIDADAYDPYGCPAPHVTYVTDSGSGDPLWGTLRMCTDSVELAGACAIPTTFDLELEGDPGDVFLELDPLGEGTPGDQFWIDGELPVDDPMLGPKGHVEGTLVVSDGCLTEPVEHRIVIDWDFPEHSEVTERVRNTWGNDGY